MPFDIGAAQRLYEKLIKPSEVDLDGVSHLIIVPTGNLTALPWQMLISRPQSNGATRADSFKEAQWLFRRYSVAILPSIASLRYLRAIAKQPRASRRLIGFGNPVFSSPNVGLAPLPGTEVELTSVGSFFPADSIELHFGGDASEALVKRATLANYKIVYFATHALSSKELGELGEPALALSHTGADSGDDDGFLTASEAAKLSLDADWVVLSACNTASDGPAGDEAVSGLARAFFYSGARSLLVSQWPVDDAAAPVIARHLFERTTSDASASSSQGLREAMLHYLQAAESDEDLEPRVWGSFVIVGDGD
jgi:CHAT domain-containing protein